MSGPCQCDGPGFCPRYHREMPDRLHELCRTRRDYRQLWDSQCHAANGDASTPRFRPRDGDPRSGVVLGSYGLPRLVELQIRLVRDTCGPVPILVADDCSPGFGSTRNLDTAYDRLQEACRRYPDVTLWPNVQRIGHTGGDLSAFWKGLIWGAALHLEVLAKLSQRFLIDLPRWLPDGARELLQSKRPLATRRCRGPESFDLRTEACLLDVVQWNRPEVLDQILPRRYGTRVTAESALHQVLRDHLDGEFWPWELYGEDRYSAEPGIVWHCANPPEDYEELAARFGLTLDGDFHTGGWQRRRDYLYG